MDELLDSHKKQRKELQAQIQKLKKSVPKGDKRRQKEVADRVAQLEAELHLRQNEELAEHGDRSKNSSELAAGVDIMRITERGDNLEDSPPSQRAPGRAQRRRDKKAAAAKRRDEEILEAARIAEEVGPRAVEYRRFNDLLTRRGLALFEVPSDGNCLYCAVQHQLSLRDRLDSALAPEESVTISWLRNCTARFMQEHADDFLPFMSNPETGEPLTPDDFSNYCEQVASTSTWGGQPEIRSLSSVLRIPIEVLQTDAPAVIVGEEFEGPPITITYHRHAFGLGEHYNSVQPLSNNAER